MPKFVIIGIFFISTRYLVSQAIQLGFSLAWRGFDVCFGATADILFNYTVIATYLVLDIL